MEHSGVIPSAPQGVQGVTSALCPPRLVGDPRHSRDAPGVAGPAAEATKNGPNMRNQAGPLHALSGATDGCETPRLWGLAGGRAPPLWG